MPSKLRKSGTATIQGNFSNPFFIYQYYTKYFKINIIYQQILLSSLDNVKNSYDERYLKYLNILTIIENIRSNINSVNKTIYRGL